MAYSEVPVPQKALQVQDTLESQKTVGSEHDHNQVMEGSSKKPKEDQIFCLIKDEWKLLHFPDNPRLDRLYNLTSDPEEQHNVIADNRARADALIKEVKQRQAIQPRSPKTVDLSKEELEHLRALGYVDGDAISLPEASEDNNKKDLNKSQADKE
jgi:arylsulfatase A-like enzyme